MLQSLPFLFNCREPATKMSISVDFLAPKPIQEGADLSNQWTRFKEEFELFLTAAEKSEADDKINAK